MEVYPEILQFHAEWHEALDLMAAAMKNEVWPQLWTCMCFSAAAETWCICSQAILCIVRCYSWKCVEERMCQETNRFLDHSVGTADPDCCGQQSYVNRCSQPNWWPWWKIFQRGLNRFSNPNFDTKSIPGDTQLARVKQLVWFQLMLS